MRKISKITKSKLLLKDNKGNALVTTCCIVLCVLLLVYCVYFFQTTVAVIRHVKDTGQICLDTYTIKTGKVIMNSIKSGHDYTNEIDSEVFLKDYRTALNISSNYTGYTDDAVRFVIQDIDTNFIVNDRLKTQVYFNLHVPVYLVGKEIYALNIPIEISSRYNAKSEIT